VPVLALTLPRGRRPPVVARAAAAAGLTFAALAWTPEARGYAQDDSRRHVTVTGRETGFDPARIEVRLNEVVQVTFEAEDAAHAFAIDAYRIARRATPGHPTTFELRADQPGTFPFYCALQAANGRTHDERGELVVRR
jgi:heme/copper-type cytochrome/quinol oxidase subunit 2